MFIQILLLLILISLWQIHGLLDNYFNKPVYKPKNEYVEEEIITSLWDDYE